MSLSDKELNPSKFMADSEAYNCYRKQDVRKAVKELKEEIDKHIDFFDNLHANCTLDELESGKTKVMVGAHSSICDIKHKLCEIFGEDLI